MAYACHKCGKLHTDLDASGYCCYKPSPELIAMSEYDKNDLIDRDYAREHFRKEPHCWKLPVEGFYLYENTSGIGHGTWTVFFVEADGDESDICRVITVGELNNVLRLLKANLAAVKAIAEIRDNVLHERGPMAESGFDSDKVNAVLGVIDDATSGLDAEVKS